MFKNISFHKTCKCGCLLDEKVCNNLQRCNGNKCRCECLKIKKCSIDYSWNFNNCRCEMKKLAALTVETEEWDVETGEIKNISECKAFPKNETLILIKKSKRLRTIYLCKYLNSLCFNHINRNNDLFLFKIKE